MARRRRITRDERRWRNLHAQTPRFHTSSRSRSLAVLDPYGTPARRQIEHPNAAGQRARRAAERAANPPHRRARPVHA